MATIQLPPTYHIEDSHEARHDTFNDEMRQELAKEDGIAFRNVCVELILIVTGGLLLGIIAVLLAV